MAGDAFRIVGGIRRTSDTTPLGKGDPTPTLSRTVTGHGRLVLSMKAFAQSFPPNPRPTHVELSPLSKATAMPILGTPTLLRKYRIIQFRLSIGDRKKSAAESSYRMRRLGDIRKKFRPWIISRIFRYCDQNMARRGGLRTVYAGGLRCAIEKPRLARCTTGIKTSNQVRLYSKMSHTTSNPPQVKL